jgi:type IV pilus assembly protein PilC
LPNYYYLAKSLSGETKKGTIQAKDEYELAKILHGQGYVLISASLEKEKKEFLRIEEIFSGISPVSLTDKLMFTRNLQVMISAGVSLPKALETLSLQAKSKRFQKALLDIGEKISKGNSFSQALEKYRNIFPELYLQMIKVGEESGTLEQSLKNLALHMEREHEIKTKIKSALIYPAVIISVMIIIAILMLILVVPQLAEMFEELNIELPFTTKLVIGLGEFLSNNILLLLLIFILFFLVLRFLLMTNLGKRAKDAILLKLPIIGPLVKKINSSYMVRTLSLLIASGISFVRSLEIVGGVLPNVYFSQAISEAKNKVQKGEKLSAVLKKYPQLFPKSVFQMIEVGEETGETSKVLAELADFFEEEVSIATKNLVAIIEPLLMVFIGAVVGFFAISMIQPIYSMIGGF